MCSLENWSYYALTLGRQVLKFRFEDEDLKQFIKSYEFYSLTVSSSHDTRSESVTAKRQLA